MSLLTRLLRRAALPWIDRVFYALVIDDGTEVYAIHGKDEQGLDATFSLRPAAFRACCAAILTRIHQEANN